MAAGTYDLIGYNTSGPGPADQAAGFVLGAGSTAPSGYVWRLATAGSASTGQLDLIVSQIANLTWTGHTNGTIFGGINDMWDTVETNWANGSAFATYTNYNSAVTFADSNAVESISPPDGTVIIASSGVKPLSVTFSNTGNPSNPQAGQVSYTVTSSSGPGIGGATGILLNGGGTVDFTGVNANTYTGATTITNGSTLVFSSDYQLGDGSSSNYLVLNNGTLNASAAGGTPSSPANVSLSSSQGVFLGNASNPGTINTAANTIFTVPGVVQDNSTDGTLIVAGPGTLMLTNTSNTYSGTTTINNGATLQVGNGSYFSGSLGAGDVTISTGGTLILASFGQTIGNNITGGGNLVYQGGGNFANTTVLTGTNSYTGTTAIQSGTLQLGNGGTTGNGSLPQNTPLILGTSDQPGQLDLHGKSVQVSYLSAANTSSVIANFNATNDYISGTVSTLTFNGAAAPVSLGSTSTYSGMFQRASRSTSSIPSLLPSRYRANRPERGRRHADPHRRQHLQQQYALRL